MHSQLILLCVNLLMTNAIPTVTQIETNDQSEQLNDKQTRSAYENSEIEHKLNENNITSENEFPVRRKSRKGNMFWRPANVERNAQLFTKVNKEIMISGQSEGNNKNVETVQIDETLPDFSSYDLLEGDILIPRKRESKNLDLFKTHLWPNKTVFYDFAAQEFTIFERNAVEAAIQQLQFFTCIKFKHATQLDGTYLRFRNIGVGCAGPVGYIPTDYAIDLFLGGPKCYTQGKILHEILHALGFWHEHMRPDRDLYIRIISENIAEGHNFNFVKHGPGVVETFGMPYDYGSIMHYPDAAFTKDGFSKTIMPLHHVPRGILGQRTGLSKVDLAKLNILYECPKPYYHGNHISGAYSISGPINKNKYLPFNQGWSYSIGPPIDENKIFKKYFNNLHHFSQVKSVFDNTKIEGMEYLKKKEKKPRDIL